MGGEVAALVQPEVKLPCSEEESVLRSRTQETFCHCRKRKKKMSDCNQVTRGGRPVIGCHLEVTSTFGTAHRASCSEKDNCDVMLVVLVFSKLSWQADALWFIVKRCSSRNVVLHFLMQTSELLLSELSPGYLICP